MVSESGPLADLGTGSGLPGLVIACLYPNLDCWLIESRRKRVSFLHEAKALLGLSRTSVLESRAETIAIDQQFRGKARFVTARAVAAETLVSVGSELLGPLGQILVMESQRSPRERLDSLAKAAGLRVFGVREYELVTGEARRIVALARP
jgi:16S rRNA (guanine527-N7)-methyltransferase